MMGRDRTQPLTVSKIRSMNMMNIMRSFIRGRTKTRSELAGENGISLMTVKHIVDDLIGVGVLEEKAGRGNELGRKPKALEISAGYGHIVCVNLTSVDEISFLIYDIYETLLHEETLELDRARGYRENLRCAVAAVGRAQSALQTAAVGAAVFVPGAYYEAADVVNYDLIGDFKTLRIKAFFTEALAVDNVLILHDVVPAAWSEYDSLSPEQESQFYFYCGHGVGGFFIHKGAAVMGEQLMAGEVGKMLVHDGNGAYRMLEDIVSVAALDRALQECGAGRLREVAGNYAAQGEAAQRAVDAALDVLARILYNLLWVYNPSRVVVDSCYDAYGALIVERLKRFMESLRNEAIPISAQVRQAAHDEYHTLRGCFHMAREAWVKEIAGFTRGESAREQETEGR